MYKKVLVAVDGSRCAGLALQEAVKFCAGCGAKLQIVHVIDYGFIKYDLGTGYEMTTLRPRLIEAGHQVLQEAAEVAMTAGVMHNEKLIDELSSIGDIAEELRREAIAGEAELVVIGTHGRHGLKRMFLGSVAESLARECRVPVMLVRDDKPPQDRSPTRRGTM